MDRRKFGAALIALVTGVALSAGSVSAQTVTGYLMGDPSPGKLVPFYRVAPNLATIVGIENTSGNAGPNNLSANDVTVHVVVFTKRSAEVLNFNLCLSPFDFGFIVLQQGAPSAAQLDEINKNKRGDKVAFLSADADFIPTEGYLSLKATRAWDSNKGSCTGDFTSFEDGDPEPLATWAILQEVGAGFFATEIPTPTALVNDTTGKVTGGTAAFGLIPGPVDPPALDPSDLGNMVIARYDVNPVNLSQTEIFVWLRRNAFNVPNDPGSGINRSSTISAWLDCEDELEVSTTVSLPDEVNIIDPAKLAGINQCKQVTPPQYRGVLRFRMPDTGFIWSQITQEGLNFRMNFLGYNLECNRFIVDWLGGSCF